MNAKKECNSYQVVLKVDSLLTPKELNQWFESHLKEVSSAPESFAVKLVKADHQWERIPNSDHHGWNPPDHRCKQCGSIKMMTDKSDLPTGPCILSDMIAKTLV